MPFQSGLKLKSPLSLVLNSFDHSLGAWTNSLVFGSGWLLYKSWNVGFVSFLSSYWSIKSLIKNSVQVFVFNNSFRFSPDILATSLIRVNFPTTTFIILPRSLLFSSYDLIKSQPLIRINKHKVLFSLYFLFLPFPSLSKSQFNKPWYIK